MLNQEDIYQLIYKEQWEKLLEILHRQKEALASDSLLLAASKTVEREFFRKVAEFSDDRDDIAVVLETFYLLNHGNFYKLEKHNVEKLGDQLSLRLPKQYRHLSSELKKRRAEEQEQVRDFSVTPSEPSDVLPDNWIEIYNRLFEIMDVKGDAATYFSGPRFINIVKQIKPYFADYSQYINQREAEGKSTTRKIYYFDILKELSFTERIKTINSILEIIRPYDRERVEAIEFLLYNKKPHDLKKESPSKVKPIVFISYSWDDEEHKTWVLDLANRLILDQVDVRIDRQLLRAGTSLQYTIEQSIAKANKILIIFTPNYKEKADQRKGGVGYEYSIMNATLYENQTINDKIIPVLRKGSKKASIPEFMQQYIHIDFRRNENFENSYNDLKREIFNEPASFQ
ncbi:toll/interleukin-1 receptor domain-containing protein [Desertivirga brevis]|uniref:toll/interleukin-1 receptor domain-containing protein n=1 Tax=Desertivirga brevis TaxID=2810310 RepID=UPI001A966CCD|nr:toll/interleukin-1 receptor domain-containing protein [Pedobacter sp. SYSU D00873]